MAAAKTTSPKAVAPIPTRQRKRCGVLGRRSALSSPADDGPPPETRPRKRRGSRRTRQTGRIMRQGVRLGIDVGDVRIGVARSDAAGIMAMPLETVPRSREGFARIASLVREWEATEVIVGWPRTLAGHEGPAARKARAFAREL